MSVNIPTPQRSNNKLEGEIPKEIGKLTNLVLFLFCFSAFDFSTSGQRQFNHRFGLGRLRQHV